MGHDKICAIILNEIRNKNPKDHMGWTPLAEAAKNGHKNVCKLIMDKVEDKNPKDLLWVTPLHEGARNGHVQLCKMIIDEVMDKNPQGTYYANTMLPINPSKLFLMLQWCPYEIEQSLFCVANNLS